MCWGSVGRVRHTDSEGAGVPDSSAGVLLVLCYCVLLAIAATLVIFTLFGQIGASLHASRAGLNWLAIVTAVGGGVGTGIFPPLGAVIGQRRLMVLAMGCLAIGSAISALAPDLALLLIGRVVGSLGVPAAVVAVALLRERLSGAALTSALGMIAVADGCAAGIGFGLGGFIETVHGANWRTVFWALALLAAIAAIAAHVVIPRAVARAVARIEVLGPALLAGGLVLLLLPVTEGSAWGWTSARTLALFVGAGAAAFAWIGVELRHRDPTIDLRVLRQSGVTRGCALYAVVGGTVTVVNLTIPSFLETPRGAGYGFDDSVLRASVSMLPFAVAITVSAFVCRRVLRARPPRLVIAASLGTELCALALLAAFHSSAIGVVCLVALFGIGHGGTLTSIYVLILRTVPPAGAGTAAGLSGVSSSIAGAVIAAVATALLVRHTTVIGGSAVPVFDGYLRVWVLGVVIAALGVVAAVMGPRSRGELAVEPSAEAVAVG
jgi:predicted MFS family arabinose efflux permease